MKVPIHRRGLDPAATRRMATGAGSLAPFEDDMTTTFATSRPEASSHVSEVAARWTTLPGGVVDGGEIVVLAIKPSMWRPVFDSAHWLVICSLLAATLTSLGTPLPGLSLTTTAQLVLFVAVARLGVAVVRWIPTWYVLTNRRVIDVRGVREPRITACSLVAVRNTYVRSSIAETCTSLGTITFVTDEPGDAPHVWQSIAQPHAVHAQIRRAIENAIDQYGIAT